MLCAPPCRAKRCPKPNDYLRLASSLVRLLQCRPVVMVAKCHISPIRDQTASLDNSLEAPYRSQYSQGVGRADPPYRLVGTFERFAARVCAIFAPRVRKTGSFRLYP